MPTTRGLPITAAIVIAAAVGGCAPVGREPAPRATSPTTSAGTAAPTDPAAAMRAWTEVAGEHFDRSANALQRVSDASAAEDQEAVQAGCRDLHDANAIGLQRDLPTPDPALTAELQRMIDDMNTATHACLRFALGRNPAEATVYQDYLARAVDHLQRAKVILDEDLGRR